MTMKLVDPIELSLNMCELCNQDYSECLGDPAGCSIYQSICRAHAIDAIPVAELMDFLDNLYSAGQITQAVIAQFDLLFSEHSGCT